MLACYIRLLLDYGLQTDENGANRGLYNVVAMQNEIEDYDRTITSNEEVYEANDQKVEKEGETAYVAFVKRLDVERMVDCITTTIQNIDGTTTCNLVGLAEKRLIQEMHRAMKGGISIG